MRIQQICTKQYANKEDYKNNRKYGYTLRYGTYEEGLLLATGYLQQDGIAVVTVACRGYSTVKLELVTVKSRKVDSSVGDNFKAWKRVNNC